MKTSTAACRDGFRELLKGAKLKEKIGYNKGFREILE